MLPKKNLEIPLRPCVGITTKSISSCSTKSTIPLQAFLAALTWGSITWKAERGAAALQSLLKIHARVKRRGIERQIAAEELVPGDVVLLESGNRVPADLRLVQVNNLAIDESLLTGESLAVEKKTFKLSEETSISERSNMAFAGSTVTTGRGMGVVVATGTQTEVGKIAKTVTSSEMTKPPLVIRMEKFAKKITFIVVGASVLLAIIAIAKGISYVEVFFMGR